MNVLFKSQCNALILDYVKSSIAEKREADRLDLMRVEFQKRTLEHRRFLRRRVLMLKQNQRDSDKRLDWMEYEQERLTMQVNELESRLNSLHMELQRDLKEDLRTLQPLELTEKDDCSKPDDWTEV